MNPKIHNPYVFCDLSNSLKESQEFDESLEEFLRKENLYETQSKSETRESVLKFIYDTISNWAIEQTNNYNIRNPENQIDMTTLQIKLFTFGSQRLEVHNSGSDIDALCLVPKFIERADFFSESLLKQFVNPRVTDLNNVPTATVPVVKMKIDDVEIDLLLANYPDTVIPPNFDSVDDSLLEKMNKECILSINGKRNTDKIIHMVKNNFDSFKKVLKLIKQWAKRRAIYGNIFGFLGGVSWTILVARIVLFQPNKTISDLLQLFMKIQSEWIWPMPVVLCPVAEKPEKSFAVEPWNPVKASVNQHNFDYFHVMPIITPAFPAINSATQVHHNHLQIISFELRRALAILSNLNTESTRKTADDIYDKLFQNFNFVNDPKDRKYTHFLKIELLSKDKASYQKFEGEVTFNLKKSLLEALQDNQHWHDIRPLPLLFESKAPNWCVCNAQLIGLDFKMVIENKQINIEDNRLKVNLSTSVEYFLNRIDESISKEKKDWRDKVNLQVKLIDKDTLKKDLNEGKLKEVNKVCKYIN